MTADVTADHATLLELMRDGKKIEAIKLYRERHGVGLKEAKDAVEALAAGREPATQADPEADDDVLELMRGGKKIEAIKKSGIPDKKIDAYLKESKQKINQLKEKEIAKQKAADKAKKKKELEKAKQFEKQNKKSGAND